MTEPLERFATAAEAYCACIDGASRFAAPAFIGAATIALTDLYRAALDLPDFAPASTDEDQALRLAAIEDAHRARNGLPEELGSYALYWHIFDPLESPPEEPVASDLRNDLIDIYQDVRTGLRSWSGAGAKDRADIAWQWRFSFVSHWGRHATAALTAMHALLYDRFIDTTESPAG